jgi:hypothetical protein
MKFICLARAQSAQVMPLIPPRPVSSSRRMMRARDVLEADPVPDRACGVLEAVEALAMDALLLERPDDALDHAVLLRAVRRDELLLQPVASDQRRIAPYSAEM